MEGNLWHFIVNKWNLKDGSFTLRNKSEKKNQKGILQKLAPDKGQELNSSG